MMPVHDIGELLTRARNSLERDISFLTAYTRIAGGISALPEDAEMPEADLFFNFGSGPTMEGGKLKPDALREEVRKTFAVHSSRYAVLAMVTAFEVYLERLHWISLLLQHVSTRGQEITAETMHSLRGGSLRVAMGKNPLQMLDTIFANVSSDEKIESRRWVSSIYGARKILSHRGGIVADVDADETGAFTLSTSRNEA